MKSLGGIWSIVVMAVVAVLFVMGLSLLVKGAWSILSFVAPVLLIITAIINHNVIVNYVKNLWTRLMTDPLIGIVYILFTVFLFPAVAAYLLGKAYLGKKLEDVMERAQQQQGGQFRTEDTDFVIVDEDVVTEDVEVEILELPEELPQKKTESGYDQLFD